MNTKASNAILPYYHPTTVCFVDDNELFLKSLELALPEDCAHMTFPSGSSALEVINHTSNVTSLADRCIEPAHLGQADVRLNLHVLEQEIARKDRFRDISVVLVDYAMPGMTGLEFCQQVKNKDLQIVLLTGAANESTAVDAFNDGLIDRYIQKGDLDTWDKIGTIIEQLKQQYFLKNAASLFASRNESPIKFRNIPEFGDYFRKLLRSQSIVEYYLAANPMGYLMLRANGSLCRLVILSETERLLQILVAEKYSAPPAILHKMRSKKYICYFAEHPQDYVHEQYPWGEVLIPAKEFAAHKQDADSAQIWYTSIVEHPPVDIDFDQHTCSFNAYVADLERERSNQQTT